MRLERSDQVRAALGAALATAWLPLHFGSAAELGEAAAKEGAAAAPAPRKLTDLSLDELTTLKVETVYGASKREQTTTEAPSAVSVVTREQIQQQGHRTLADILNSVRGVYVTYDRAYHYIGVRGFNRPGDFGGRVLLMVDGHRLNDGVYDTAASGIDFPVDVDLIERVEVIRGPGSSLYGNNAFFGVINVITRRGEGLDGAEVSGSYGSFDTWTGRASYGERFANGVEVLVSGTLYDTDGQDTLGYPEFEADGLDGAWAGQFFGRVAYKDLTLQGGYGRREKDWPTAAYDTVPNAQDPRLWSVDARAFADLTWDHEFAQEWRVTARSYFDRYEFDADYPYDYDGDPVTALDLNRDLAVATAAGLDLTVRKPLGEAHELTLGGEWRHDFELRQENWDENPYTEYLNSVEAADLLGVFVQDEWRLRRNLVLSAGVRYDYYTVFGDTLNPRAGVIYTPWEPTTFKALYGQAFRAPNAYELYYAGYGARGNPDLQPETIRAYELVWEQRFGSHVRTSVSAFWNDVSDLINQDLDPGADLESPDDDLFFFNNTGSAVARGVEFEVEGKASWGLRGLASYAFTDTEDKTTGEALNNSPQHLGKVNLSLPFWRDKVFGGLELQAMSERKTVAGDTTGAYAVVNLTLFSRELLPGLEASASVYNLFDQRYAHPVSGDFLYTGPMSGELLALDRVEQDGRTFRVKLSYRF